MARFNKAPAPAKTIVNRAGGEAYAQSPELALVSLLLTNMVKDQYYRASDEALAELRELIKQCDPYFVAQATVYARREFGMRSITHVMASELAKYASGKDWGTLFYNGVINRVDDMLEISSYHKGNKQKITNAMKKGFAQAINRFDEYSLAKYRGENKEMKLVDLVNLVHPTPGARAGKALEKLVDGTLKSVDTWEVKLTQAGQKAEDADDLAGLKADAWSDMILNKKIKYFALLRNLRNIVQHAPTVLDVALKMIVDRDEIKKSLIMPFQFQTAYQELKKNHGAEYRKAMIAVAKAIDISCDNVPKFPGDSLVVLDISGSMSGQPAEIGSLFAAILVKALECDFMVFGSSASYVTVNTMDSTVSIAENMRFDGGGTNFHSIFQTASKSYDRIFILSDMQGWIGHNTPKVEYANYKKRTGSNPYVYSFDLNGSGNMQFPEKQVVCLAGFSDKIFDIMKESERDKNALINIIKAYDMTPKVPKGKSPKSQEDLPF